MWALSRCALPRRDAGGGVCWQLARLGAGVTGHGAHSRPSRPHPRRFGSFTLVHQQLLRYESFVTWNSVLLVVGGTMCLAVAGWFRVDSRDNQPPVSASLLSLTMLAAYTMSLPALLYLHVILSGTVVAQGSTGTLNIPSNGDQWNAANGGLGHVQYQGVDDHDDGPNPTWRIRTFSIDIYLATPDASDMYYLARGIQPDPASNMVDQYFRVPYSSGTYLLVVEEMQRIWTVDPMNFTRSYAFVSAAPSITIVSTNTTTKRSIALGLASDTVLGTRQSPPQGTPTAPSGDVTWNNTDGWCSGQVTYQGVNADYSSGSITHVHTLAVDIAILVGSNPPYYLAKGIAPKGQTVDVSFYVPPYLNGTYTINVTDTQIAQDPTLPFLTTWADNPSVTIMLFEPWLLPSLYNASGGQATVDWPPTNSSSSDRNGGNANIPWPLEAIVLVAIFGCCTLILLGLVLYQMSRWLARRDRKTTYIRPTGDLSEGDSPAFHQYLATPFVTPPTSSAGPSTAAQPDNDLAPPDYKRSERFVYRAVNH